MKGRPQKAFKLQAHIHEREGLESPEMEFKAVHIECLIPQNDRHRQIYSHMSEVDGSLLLCLDWIYGLPFTMGKWFLTDNSSTVGRILMISSADPHEILTLRKW